MRIIRQAELRDIAALLRLINGYAAENLLLPRTSTDLSENLGDFLVAEERQILLGCGALKLYGNGIAEIRSLCVERGKKSSGLGSALTERLLEEAEKRGLKTVFALTVAPEFFRKCGFQEAPRHNFPLKIWRDCLSCPKLFHCDETTMAYDLAARKESFLETEEVGLAIS